MSNYTKLKTNLKLAIQRLKLLEKKKTELSFKSRKEIADYIQLNKPDRARIRVEHIIREDNYVEAMEMIEMFCDLLLARFGLIEKMKAIDPGLDEAIATVLWAAPRISNDIQEFKTISEIFLHKYGKNYVEGCKTDQLNNVNDKVKRKLGVEPPPKLLIEQYLIEIAKNFNLNYEPDRTVMLQSGQMDEELISLRDRTNEITRRGGGGNDAGSGSGGSGGGGGACAAPFENPPSNNKIGFRDETSARSFPSNELIDLNDSDDDDYDDDGQQTAAGRSDFNNNYVKDAGPTGTMPKRAEFPQLPDTMPFGDARAPSPPPSYDDKPSNLNKKPVPPNTTHSQLNPNFKHQLPSYDTPKPGPPSDMYGTDEAPPLPSKNDPLYPTTNDLERSRPPTYEQSNEFDSNKKKEKSNFADVDNDDNLDLPSVPTDNNNLRIHSQASNQAPNNNNNNQSDSCDFDELTRRFENLKSNK